ncbi:hypothetical protein ACFQL1_17580 [Halomicroarcula sp. GCM10025709]|uniref:hypothetical protein n=1 Tax=Haloarcula TaxID=2237 RepID=UPI0024C346D3|nr:hypothetical protein [Halomicroarcula sp. YJ-61-S]
MGGVFGSKPSDAHVVWRSGRDDDGVKQFDFEYLRLWAAHFGVDYEQWERVDHERADEPRTQHACVFHWAETGGQEFSLGGADWSMGSQEKPRTFIEIDEAGMGRFKGWASEAVLDIDELVLDGTTCRLRTADGTRKALDVSKLTTEPSRT